MDHWAGADAVQGRGHRWLGPLRRAMDGAHDGSHAEAQLVHGVQIPLDAADGQPPLFPQRGDQAEQVDAEALLAQDHAVQFRRRCAAPSARRTSPSNVDVLGNFRRNLRQLDDFPTALGPTAGQLGSAVGAALHHMLHLSRGRHATAGKAVASLLAGLLLRWGLPGRFRLEAGHSERVARFRLAFQFGNSPLQPLNHRL